MGMLAQIIDLENGTVLATIPSGDEPNNTEIISATISSLGIVVMARMVSSVVSPVSLCPADGTMFGENRHDRGAMT